MEIIEWKFIYIIRPNQEQLRKMQLQVPDRNRIDAGRRFERRNI
jgi:hypothetical protein